MTVDAISKSLGIAPASGPASPPVSAAPTADPERTPLPAASVTATDEDRLRARVNEEATRFEELNQSLTFRVHEDSGQLMVQVVDRDSGKVLRETPPKDFLDLTVRLRDMVGFFLDETR